MKNIDVSGSIYSSVFDSDDYIKNHKQINKYLYNIIANNDINFAREYIDNLNGDIFLQGKEIYIYILFEDAEPVSFAIYSKNSDAKVTLDLICTNMEYAKLGFATILLRISAIDIKDSEISTTICATEKYNEVLKSLLFSFSKVEGIVFKQHQNQYIFDVKNINSKQILSDIKKFAI